MGSLPEHLLGAHHLMRPATSTIRRRSYDRQMVQRDWLTWHEPYNDPSSPLARRLASVQSHLRTALDRCPTGTIQMVSMCAGQGRDVFGVLGDHARRCDVRAVLVELDERNVRIANQSAIDLDLVNVEVVRSDAGVTDPYRGHIPAGIVLVCGVFGNISDADIETTVGALPSLCAPNSTVIWTRHRRPPDVTPRIRQWFSTAGFEVQTLEHDDDGFYGVGVGRFRGSPRPFVPGKRLFTFVGYDNLATQPGGRP